MSTDDFFDRLRRSGLPPIAQRDVKPATTAIAESPAIAATSLVELLVELENVSPDAPPRPRPQFAPAPLPPRLAPPPPAREPRRGRPSSNVVDLEAERAERAKRRGAR